ncbi:MAG: N-formylglutamate deformylase [Woeseiaceae bacterium]|nr:N-formylglutamate deformylase [Woeseiaceae bacterium]
MSDVYRIYEGSSPLLVSVPHDGRDIPAAIARHMTAAGKAIPDTDWHVAKLYDFVRDTGASLLVANVSRYVIDLNRSENDDVLYPGQLVTGLCPVRTFAGEHIYGGQYQPDDKEKADRIARYWRPYHDRIRAALGRLVELHGYALLWDAHSIPSRVPTIFEGELPVLNVGTNDGRSCDPALQEQVAEVAAASGLESVVNGRFKGGYITRHYGAPKNDVHAIQLEIAQRAYMDETSGRYVADSAARLQKTLAAMLDAFTIQAAFRQR